MTTRTVSFLSLLLLAFAAAPVRAQAPKEVVIGVLYPLSGPVAQVGIDSVNAVKLAAEIINNGASALALPLGKGQNSGVRAILQQVQKGAYVTIYPFELAVADPVYPMTPWKDRR